MTNKMKTVNTSPAAVPRTPVRGALLTLALCLACNSIWVLCVEASRATLVHFPARIADTAAAQKDRKFAKLAASFGIVRGDLWAEYALTYLSLVWSDEYPSSTAQSTADIDEAIRAVHRALIYAPHDARIWLTMAGINARLNRDMRAALQMSYYTGSNELQLIPLRLTLASKEDALDDIQIQQFVKHDIGIALSFNPKQTNAIIAAYRHASTIGQQFFEKTITEIDPSFLPALSLAKSR